MEDLNFNNNVTDSMDNYLEDDFIVHRSVWGGEGLFPSFNKTEGYYYSESLNSKIFKILV